MVRLLGLTLFLTLIAGCGRGEPERAARDKFITLEEWSKMSEAEKNDPYVLERLEKKPPMKKDKTPWMVK